MKGPEGDIFAPRVLQQLEQIEREAAQKDQLLGFGQGQEVGILAKVRDFVEKIEKNQ